MFYLTLASNSPGHSSLTFFIKELFWHLILQCLDFIMSSILKESIWLKFLSASFPSLTYDNYLFLVLYVHILLSVLHLSVWSLFSPPPATHTSLSECCLFTLETTETTISNSINNKTLKNYIHHRFLINQKIDRHSYINMYIWIYTHMLIMQNKLFNSFCF